MRRLIFIALGWFCLSAAGQAEWPQTTAPVITASEAMLDSDGDGLSDALEQALLQRFAPVFQVAEGDCARLPARFAAGRAEPAVEAEDGTLYGQVTPRAVTADAPSSIEVRYYHLWGRDCGRLGHALDTEHVSVLLRATGGDPGPAAWRATYWFAAAHQNTVCDASQIARAATLKAEQGGTAVFVSAGKHASFLNAALCTRGCGGDSCVRTRPLAQAGIVNLGEPCAPMNGALWIGSPLWPLGAKMAQSDFPPDLLARLERLPATDIAWATPGKHPAQATIAVSNATAGAIAQGGSSTDTALSLASGSTGNALGKTYKNVKRALGLSARKVGKALQIAPPEKAAPR